MTKQELKLIVVGAGQRGKAYSRYLDVAPGAAKIVAIADPIRERVEKFAQRFDIPPKACFRDYKELEKEGPNAFGAQAVLILTQDRMHKECVLMFARLGYHIMCEKPMSTDLQDCQEMLDAVKRAGTLFAMGHVLRYSPHNQQLKKLLDEKVIGDIISINHTEPVGYSHFAHSYVRGHWRKESSSSFSLLAKSCHDIDLIQWMMGTTSTASHITKPIIVSSFGSLTHFRKENKPKEAGEAKRCLDCAFERKCPYSAKKIYLDQFMEAKRLRGFATAVCDVEDVPSIESALKNSNFGRCVYEMDNDVCDHQVVNLMYDTPYGMASVAFTMIAFSEAECVRKTTIYGSRGEINADGTHMISVRDFETNLTTTHRIDEILNEEGGSHGGGDFGLMRCFLGALDDTLNGRDAHEAQLEWLGCSPDDIFASHRLVFDAERSRRDQKVIQL